MDKQCERGERSVRCGGVLKHCACLNEEPQLSLGSRVPASGSPAASCACPRRQRPRLLRLLLRLVLRLLQVLLEIGLE